jgi:quercetin dioxygenase-like cupin family protein
MTTTSTYTNIHYADADGPAPAFPIARLDLVEEVRKMRASPRPKAHTAKTLVRTLDQRLVLMLLDRGAQIPVHQTEAPLTIQALDGRVIVSLLASTFDLGPGQLLAIERDVPHAMVAIEDSAVLLTLAWHGHA